MLNAHVFEIIFSFHKLIFDLWKNQVVFLNNLHPPYIKLLLIDEWEGCTPFPSWGIRVLKIQNTLKSLSFLNKSLTFKGEPGPFEKWECVWMLFLKSLLYLLLGWWISALWVFLVLEIQGPENATYADLFTGGWVRGANISKCSRMLGCHPAFSEKACLTLL